MRCHVITERSPFAAFQSHHEKNICGTLVYTDYESPCQIVALKVRHHIDIEPCSDYLKIEVSFYL